MRSGIVRLAGLMVVLVSAAYAEAAVTLTNDRTAFESQAATIAHNYGFEDVTLNSIGFYYAPEPWETHGVTYTTGGNVVIGTGIHQPISNVFMDNSWSPLTADIQTVPSFDMLGFDVGYLNLFGQSGLIDITVDTNVASYQHLDLSVPHASSSLVFYGFVSDSPSEYFTGFSLSRDYVVGNQHYGPAVDNVTLGNVIPEPSTFIIWSLLATLGITAGWWRRRRVV